MSRALRGADFNFHDIASFVCDKVNSRTSTSYELQFCKSCLHDKQMILEGLPAKCGLGTNLAFSMKVSQDHSPGWKASQRIRATRCFLQLCVRQSHETIPTKMLSFCKSRLPRSEQNSLSHFAFLLPAISSPSCPQTVRLIKQAPLRLVQIATTYSLSLLPGSPGQ